VPNSSGTSVTLGVDTHADVHIAAALDQLGRRLGTLAVPSSPAGYASLEVWATGLGTVEQVGMEGNRAGEGDEVQRPAHERGDLPQCPGHRGDRPGSLAVMTPRSPKPIHWENRLNDSTLLVAAVTRRRSGASER
jgi:hypothetical protein